MILAMAWLFWRIKYTGIANIPLEGPVIIASNHISHLDPPLIGVGVKRPVTFIAKMELFKVPFIGWWLRQLGQISVTRGGGGKAALETAIEALKDGRVIIIFPEGTRSPTGRMQRGRSGVAVLALKTGAPVVPASIEGSFEAFGKGKFVPRPGRVKVVYGKPLTFKDKFTDGDVISRKALDDITTVIMEEIIKLLPEKQRPEATVNAETTLTETELKKSNGG